MPRLCVALCAAAFVPRRDPQTCSNIRITIVSIVLRKVCMLKLGTQARNPGRWVLVVEFARGRNEDLKAGLIEVDWFLEV